jgi:hypothetical protein
LAEHAVPHQQGEETFITYFEGMLMYFDGPWMGGGASVKFGPSFESSNYRLAVFVDPESASLRIQVQNA